MLTAGGDRDRALLESELAVDGVATSSAEASEWLAARRGALQGTVEEVPLSGLRGWRFERPQLTLVHESGGFFSVAGHSVRLEHAAHVQTFEQPLIHQPEIGVLGFLAKKFDGVLHVLVQAKMEPGNVGAVQLAPTVQATRSNYTRLHGGRRPPYLEYFVERGRGEVLVDEPQSEQASFFVAKRNRNVVVETDKDVPAAEDFRWLTLGQVRLLLQVDHAVNMDARSVLSCLWPAGTARDARPERSLGELVDWLERLRARASIALGPRSLDALAGWRFDGRRITPVGARRPFEVVGVRVRAHGREVAAWEQPLLKRETTGLLGFLCQERRGTLHVLARATVAAGCRRTLELGPTVCCHGEEAVSEGTPRFVEWFRGAGAGRVRFDALQSEEGGRFDRFEYRYLIVEAPADTTIDAPEDYAWITLDQLSRLRARGDVAVEARNLLACLGLGEPRGYAQGRSGRIPTSGT